MRERMYIDGKERREREKVIMMMRMKMMKKASQASV